MSWRGGIVIVGLLGLLVGLPLLMSGGQRHLLKPTGADGARLVILTPHNEQIRYEFERAFNQWRQSNTQPPVVFDWRTSGGTSDLRKLTFDQFEAKIRQGREDEGIEHDLFFGGGDYEHGLLAHGISVMRGEQKVQISLTVPVEMPPGMLETVFPQPTIGSEPLYGQQLRWVGVALASFGIVYNSDVLQKLDLAPPTQWTDLSNPRYMHWIALADPAHSGSIAATYNAILRRLGWNEGWKVLRRIFANSRYFTSSASKVPVDVSAGEAAAGMCIDFYGRLQSGAIAGHRVGYVDPKHMTAITADPISILRGAPNRELANTFVLWLLSREAQQLWQRKKGGPGGPDKFELRRLPVRRDVYTPDQMQQWVDRSNPFELARSFPDGMPNFYRAVAPVAHALAIDIHSDLRAAWIAIHREPHAAKRKEMTAIFDAMPPELQVQWPDSELAMHWRDFLEDSEHPRHQEVAAVLSDFMGRLKQRMKQRRLFELTWTKYFRAQYRRVARM